MEASRLQMHLKLSRLGLPCSSLAAKYLTRNFQLLRMWEGFDQRFKTEANLKR